jgi:biopolymer transport protein ExbD
MPKRTDIKSILIICAVLLSSCASLPAVDQTLLDNIATACNLPKSSAIYNPDDSVELKISQNANYDDVNCLLEKLKANGVKKLGFIGNEQYRVEEEQK